MEIKHEEIVTVSEAIALPPYADPISRQYAEQGKNIVDAKHTIMAVGFLRGIQELSKRGYKIVKSDDKLEKIIKDFEEADKPIGEYTGKSYRDLRDSLLGDWADLYGKYVVNILKELG